MRTGSPVLAPAREILRLGSTAAGVGTSFSREQQRSETLIAGAALSVHYLGGLVTRVIGHAEIICRGGLRTRVVGFGVSVRSHSTIEVDRHGVGQCEHSIGPGPLTADRTSDYPFGIVAKYVGRTYRVAVIRFAR